MENNIIPKILEYLKENKRKCLGSLIGFLIAIMTLVIGVFKTLFIFIFIFIGSYLGKKMDEGFTLKDLLIKFISKINKDFM